MVINSAPFIIFMLGLLVATDASCDITMLQPL